PSFLHTARGHLRQCELREFQNDPPGVQPINARIGDMDYSSKTEGNADISANVESPNQRTACEKGNSTMILDKTHRPPNSKLPPHPVARPPLSRRIKHWGMKTAGQLASVLRHLPRKPSENEFGILAYHRVAPIQPNCPPPTINVTPDRFREQITGLLRQGF